MMPNHSLKDFPEALAQSLADGVAKLDLTPDVIIM